jgi:hypothetical protein
VFHCGANQRTADPATLELVSHLGVKEDEVVAIDAVAQLAEVTIDLDLEASSSAVVDHVCRSDSLGAIVHRLFLPARTVNEDAGVKHPAGTGG